MPCQFFMNINVDTLPLPSILKNYCIGNIQDYKEKRNLFDIEEKISRKVLLTHILTKINTEEDWKGFIFELEGIDLLILVLDIKPEPLQILINFYNDLLKAIYARFSQYSINVIFSNVD